jgi:hypothetical protein
VAKIPRAVLSDTVQSLLDGRRVAAGVFLTYTLEPQFFEEEVVSLLSDDALSVEPKLRMVQLEEVLRSKVGPLAVYYDIGGVRSEGAARLDIKRFPISVSAGVFHPKAVILLAEPAQPDDKKKRAIICAVMSANLAKSSWWSNLESCHVETIEAESRCSFREDLRDMLAAVRKLAGDTEQHDALDAIRRFLKDEVYPVEHATFSGRLRTRLIAGTGRLIDSLVRIRGRELEGTRLEVISPFFDKHRATALRDLVGEIGIAKAHVFLPKTAVGQASCSEAYYQDVVDAGFNWAQIRGETELLRLGKDKNAKARSVHAKVYRFTKPNGYEALLIGSHNLTTPAHQRGSNFEASFFVEPEPHGRLEPWLDIDEKKPREFDVGDPNLEATRPITDASVPVQVRFNWIEPCAGQLRWGGASNSPAFEVLSAGELLLSRRDLPPREWHDLTAEETASLQKVLVSSALLRVRLAEGQQGTILVQEDGMSRKPSVLLSLSPTEILAYWSRLTPSQRVQYLEERFDTVDGSALNREGIEAFANPAMTSMFDTYAGLFHAFDMLREQINAHLEQGKTKAAEYLVFGNRHDSLPRLLEKVVENTHAQDAVSRYLTLLCAHQLLKWLKRAHREFASLYATELQTLYHQSKAFDRIRGELDVGADGETFLDWFERRFLQQAAQSAAVAND